MNLFKQGISKDATDSATLGINTRSFEVSNMSQYDLQINDPILNGYRLPAYASKTFEATPGMTIDFQLVAPVVNTNGTTSTQYVQIAESPVSVVTPVTPLALIPIYNLPITGTVNADITNANVPVSGSVAISSGTVDATIQNATIDTSVTNANLKTTNSVVVKVSFGVNNLPAGASLGSGDLQIPLDYYDGFYIIGDSANGYMDGRYEIQTNASGLWFSDGAIAGGSAPYGAVSTTGQSTYTITGQNIGFKDLGGAFPGNVITFNLVNKSSSTIVSDTFYVTVIVRLASSEVINPTSNPVNTQSVNGSPTASNVVNTTGGATTPLISSGGVIKKIYIGACASGGAFPNPCTLHVINGSANVAEFDVSGMVQYQWKTFELDFGDGIANSGISVYYGAVGTPPNGQATGYAIMQ